LTCRRECFKRLPVEYLSKEGKKELGYLKGEDQCRERGRKDGRDNRGGVRKKSRQTGMTREEDKNSKTQTIYKRITRYAIYSGFNGSKGGES